MTDKEFKRLNRAQLIDIIYQLQLKHDELTAENENLTQALADKRLRISKIRMMREETREECERILEQARKEAEDIVAKAKKVQPVVPAKPKTTQKKKHKKKKSTGGRK